jgi:hypothetical protein
LTWFEETQDSIQCQALVFVVLTVLFCYQLLALADHHEGSGDGVATLYLTLPPPAFYCFGKLLGALWL